MVAIGTPLSASATRVLLLGSGELGFEIAIELRRLGAEVMAVDRYANAPAMQVASSHAVLDLYDEPALNALIVDYQPHIIIPEIEGIAAGVLPEAERRGIRVIPCADAVVTAMNRESLRRLATEIGLATTRYAFASSEDELRHAVDEIGLPCVVKPLISSSGHGQTVVRKMEDVAAAWQSATTDGRAQVSRVIVEEFVAMDYELTQLVVRHAAGETLLPVIGHRQQDGDYLCSWQPHELTTDLQDEVQRIACLITRRLGGVGVFGVELFVVGGRVLFNEVAVRPHDTGMVTMASMRYSQFALHARAALNLPIPIAITCQPAASQAIIVQQAGTDFCYQHLEQVLANTDVDIRLFGKPIVATRRRMGVLLATADSPKQALELLGTAISKLEILWQPYNTSAE